jgi:VanZ family protein
MRLALASAVSVAVVLAAPFMGQLNAWLRRTAPDQYLVIVISAVSVLMVLGIIAAVRHIREQRALRYGAIAAALGCAAAYSLATATGSRDVDWVERVHLVEYGTIAFLFYRAWRGAGDVSSFILPVLAGLFVGLAEEWLQWFIPVRVGELHDVLLNLVAVSCGLVFSVAADPPDSFSWRLSPVSRRRLAVMGSLVILGFAFFIDQVHRGHVIERADIGVFRSHYTVDQLTALARDRSARWQAEPPLTFRRLSREDQYMDEGLWHVRRRNLVDEPEAWAENRILEEFYAPVLDTPSYTSKTGHRWAPEQRANAEAAATANPAPFVSAAQPYPIYAIPRWLLWSAAGIIVAALVSWPQRTQRTRR